MSFYIILTIVCMSISYTAHLAYKYNIANKYIVNIIDFIPYLILIIITGFRFNVGNDYQGYARNFLYLMDYDIPRIETSFKIIANTARFFGFNQQFMFLTYSAITYIFIYLGVRYFDKHGRYRHYVILFIVIFFLFNIFNTIRQMVAAAIFFYALKFIVEKKLYKYMFFILLAIFFHRSAIICIPLYFLLKLRMKTLFLGLAFSPILLFSDLANKFIGLYIRFSGQSVYEVYLNNYNYRVPISGGKGLFLFFITAMFLALTIGKFNFNDRDKIIIKLFIIFVILTFATLSSVIATRLVYYPMFSLLLIIPLLQNCFKNEKERILGKYLINVLSVLLFINMLSVYRNLFIKNELLHYVFKIFI
ncbi:EpsG family protein [Clostridia bacterium]|nr:EpsG family protein [Clostridia bacterium]